MLCILFCSEKPNVNKKMMYGVMAKKAYTFCSPSRKWIVVCCRSCISTQHQVGDASWSARSHWLLQVSVEADYHKYQTCLTRLVALRFCLVGVGNEIPHHRLCSCARDPCAVDHLGMGT